MQIFLLVILLAVCVAADDLPSPASGADTDSTVQDTSVRARQYEYEVLPRMEPAAKLVVMNNTLALRAYQRRAQSVAARSTATDWATVRLPLPAGP